MRCSPSLRPGGAPLHQTPLADRPPLCEHLLSTPHRTGGRAGRPFGAESLSGSAAPSPVRAARRHRLRRPVAVHTDCRPASRGLRGCPPRRTPKGEWMYGNDTGRRRTVVHLRVGGAARLLTLAGCGPSDPRPDDSIRRPASAARQGHHAVLGQSGRQRGPAGRRVSEEGEDGKAELIKKIAEQPVAEWIGPDDPQGEARGFTEAAAKAGPGRAAGPLQHPAPRLRPVLQGRRRRRQRLPRLDRQGGPGHRRPARPR